MEILSLFGFKCGLSVKADVDLENMPQLSAVKDWFAFLYTFVE